jgi:hypothetical protein
MAKTLPAKNVESIKADANLFMTCSFAAIHAKAAGLPRRLQWFQIYYFWRENVQPD